jgi:hypothetical protein
VIQVGDILRRAPEGNWVRYRTEDGFEVIGDGSLLPRSFEACFPDDSGAPELHLRIEMRGGIPQCRQLLLLCPPGDREVRQSDLRSADVEHFLRVACRFAAVHVTEELEGGGIVVTDQGTEADLARAARAVSQARRNTRRKIPADKLSTVADVYRANPGRPTAAVAERFDIALRTASLYVHRAREAGLLKEDGNGAN